MSIFNLKDGEKQKHKDPRTFHINVQKTGRRPFKPSVLHDYPEERICPDIAPLSVLHAAQLRWRYYVLYLMVFSLLIQNFYLKGSSVQLDSHGISGGSAAGTPADSMNEGSLLSAAGGRRAHRPCIHRCRGNIHCATEKTKATKSDGGLLQDERSSYITAENITHGFLHTDTHTLCHTTTRPRRRHRQRPIVYSPENKVQIW